MKQTGRDAARTAASGRSIAQRLPRAGARRHTVPVARRVSGSGARDQFRALGRECNGESMGDRMTKRVCAIWACAVAGMWGARAAHAQSGGGRERFPDFTEVVLLPTPSPVPLPGQKPPQFPNNLRQAGRESFVVAAGVVDTSGSMDLRSVSFLQLTDARFRGAVCDWLSRLRLQPYADSTGLRRALVLVPLAFEITGDRPPKGAPATMAYEMMIRRAPRDSVLARLESLPHCR